MKGSLDQSPWRTEIAAIFAIRDGDAHRGPQKSLAISETLHCVWKVASDLRFRVAIAEAETPSFCGISGDLAPSTRKSVPIAIVRFWCAKSITPYMHRTEKTA